MTASDPVRRRNEWLIDGSLPVPRNVAGAILVLNPASHDLLSLRCLRLFWNPENVDPRIPSYNIPQIWTTMSQSSPGVRDSSLTMDNTADILTDDAVSIHSFDTILPSYSEATLPSYSPPASSSHTRLPQAPPPASRTTVVHPPREPQILSISQSNLPLRFTGPQSRVWSPKLGESSIPSRKKRPGAELNIFFRNNKPPTAALAHGDTSESAPSALRRPSIPVRTNQRTYDEELRMRELDELTRAVSRGSRQTRNDPKPIPQIVGGLRRESSLLGDEWDNLAAEAQREEINIRMSEIESYFAEQNRLPAGSTAVTDLTQEITTLQSILSSRRDSVAGILSRNVSRLRELKNARARVSHVQKDQIKTDIFSMKAEITFLERRVADLERFSKMVEQDDLRLGMVDESRRPDVSALEDDSRNWDHWFEAN